MSQELGQKERVLETEPQLFDEERPEKKVRIKTKLMFCGLLMIGAFVLWPKSSIEGEAVLQAEKFQRMGLTSSGVLKELVHEKGQVIKQGDLIARFENHELVKLRAQAEFELQRLEGEKEFLEDRLQYLEKVRERTQMLYENNVVSKVALEEFEFGFVEANQALGVTEKNIKLTEEELKFLKSEISALELRAPFDGVLLSDPSDVIGSFVGKGDFVLEMVAPETYFLEVLVPEKEITRVAAGNKVKARFHAFPQKIYTGEVTRIGPRTVQEVEKVFKVRHMISCEIKLETVHEDLKYGMRASVKIKRK